MNTRLLFPLVAVALFACSGQAPEAVVDKPTSSIERIEEEVADISIDGMSCEMMCGSSIKKALAALPGVNSTEIKFIEGDVRDHAVVNYDAAKISDAQMIDAIQSLYDGQYKVVAVKVTKQVPAVGGAATSGKTAEEAKPVSVLNPASVVVPGLLSLLAYVLRV